MNHLGKSGITLSLPRARAAISGSRLCPQNGLCPPSKAAIAWHCQAQSCAAGKHRGQVLSLPQIKGRITSAVAHARRDPLSMARVSVRPLLGVTTHCSHLSPIPWIKSLLSKNHLLLPLFHKLILGSGLGPEDRGQLGRAGAGRRVAASWFWTACEASEASWEQRDGEKTQGHCATRQDSHGKNTQQEVGRQACSHRRAVYQLCDLREITKPLWASLIAKAGIELDCERFRTTFP